VSKIRVVVDVISRTPEHFGETLVIFPMGHPHKKECLQEVARHLTTYGDAQSREEAQAIMEANRTDTTMVKPPWVLQAEYEAEQRDSGSFATAADETPVVVTDNDGEKKEEPEGAGGKKKKA
jgi:hypothetical protein